jgi:uncharacterized membrane-anchored protein YhcB (DUF1043 family)
MYCFTCRFFTLFFFCITGLPLFSQVDSTITLTFDFNDHQIIEKDHLVIPKPVGVSLTNDRFGNAQSAVYIHGHLNSYLNLGTSPLLKPKKGTVSLWVNHERKVFAGKGYESNPILITKNSTLDDFNDSYSLFYDFKSERFMVFSSKDSTEQAGANSIEKVIFNQWYHLIFTYDDTHIAFYINGELQLRSRKNFETVFNPLDSVVVGHGANKKNQRCMRGSVDDIRFFHRVLSQREISDLYHAPNPNKWKRLMQEFLWYGGIILVLVIVIVLLIIRNKRNLKKQKEQFELVNRVTELELQVVKAQINPHFISNCLAAIQELVYEDVDKAGQYIARFSYFLRQVLNYSDKNYITLSEELEIVKLNVELEQLRFKDQFDFAFEVSEEVDQDQLIPALISQPFVENAIWHGLLPLNNQRVATLTVRVIQKADTICIEIEDNGVGRKSPEEPGVNSKGTKLVLDKLEALNRLSKGVKHRVEIIDLKDESGKPAGTKVVILIDTMKL